MIDWEYFTPWTALTGGLIIGTAAALLVLFTGRIAGISGIAGGLLRPVRHDTLWRLLFLAGLLASPFAYRLFAPLPEIRIAPDWPGLVAAGLLVGLGTRYASGCTSGHGVCGLSLGSLRSLVATLCFMASGFVTVFILRHVAGAAA